MIQSGRGDIIYIGSSLCQIKYKKDRSARDLNIRIPFCPINLFLYSSFLPILICVFHIRYSREKITFSFFQMTTQNQQLVDLDWKFAINVANSESDGNAGAARLYLKLTTMSNNGTNRTDIPLSVTLEQFYALVHQLEKAKLEMDVYA
jgi:hypothetical protein